MNVPTILLSTANNQLVNLIRFLVNLPPETPKGLHGLPPDLDYSLPHPTMELQVTATTTSVETSQSLLPLDMQGAVASYPPQTPGCIHHQNAEPAPGIKDGDDSNLQSPSRQDLSI